MKTNLKHIFFLAALALATTACGGKMTKPKSGFDVSALSPGLLSITPTVPNTPPAISTGQQQPAGEAKSSSTPQPANTEK